LDLKQLEYFVRVAEFGSFTRAANAISVEQPAVSKQVRQLEVELRQSLLTRTGRGVIPTPAGKLLLEEGRAILYQVACLQENLERFRGALSGSLALGMSPSIARVLAGPLILELRRQLPQVRLAISEGMTQPMQDAVCNGSMDAAFLYNIAPSPDLAVDVLIEEELVLVQRKSRQEGAVPREVQVQELARTPLVLLTRPNTTRLLVESELAARGLKPRIEFEVERVSTVLDLLASGAGSSLLPRRAVQTWAHANRFMMRRIVKPPMHSRLCMVMSRRHAPTTAQQAALDVIVPLARRLLA
jgi:LysR family nitrogen assimilation transcriptional regulator